MWAVNTYLQAAEVISIEVCCAVICVCLCAAEGLVGAGGCSLRLLAVGAGVLQGGKAQQGAAVSRLAARLLQEGRASRAPVTPLTQ